VRNSQIHIQKSDPVAGVTRTCEFLEGVGEPLFSNFIKYTTLRTLCL